MELWSDAAREAFALLVSGDQLVLDAAWRSLWISALAVALAALVGVPLGCACARARVPGGRALVFAARVGMGLPTVLIGLSCYALFSRRGPLGAAELLYTPWGVVLGEFCLALPILIAWTDGAVRTLDPRLAETVRTLGAGSLLRARTYLSEARGALLLALLTAFGRCATELGIAMMVGGNVAYRTRTLTTATALETARGEFARGLAMSSLLLVVALAVTLATELALRGERPAR